MRRIKDECPLFFPTYDGAATNDHHDLIDDYDDAAYSGPHWNDDNEDGDATDENDTLFPTAYVSGGTMKIDGKFKIKGLSSTSSTPNVQIKGTGPNGLIFDAVVATVSGGYATATLTASSAFLASTVRYFDSFTVNWESSLDGGATWADAGTTANQICVLFAQPTGPLLTTFAMTSSKAADGESNAASIVAKTWNEFSDINVMMGEDAKRPGEEKKPDRQLTYWKSNTILINGMPAHPNRSAEAMLKSENGDGDCEAFSDLFVKVLRAQGVDGAQKVWVRSTYFDKVAANMAAVGPRAAMVFNYVTFGQPTVMRFDGWNYRDGEWQDVGVGMTAHGNAAPPRIWFTHMIVKYDGKFYDPSYGGDVRANRKEWEDFSLAGSQSTRIESVPDGENFVIREFRAVKKNVLETHAQLGNEREVEFLDETLTINME